MKEKRLSRFSNAVSTAVGLGALLILCPANLLATQFRSADVVEISGGEILDDIFTAGGDIHLDAVVIGDFFAAGRTITVSDSADIDNSVMAVGQRVDINGRVRNSVRVAAQTTTVRGHIERNLLAFSENITLDSRGWVEKDATLFGNEIVIRGRVGGLLHAGGNTVTIAGQIDGDAKIEGHKVVILPTAIIGGRLTIESENEPTIDEGASILGGVTVGKPEGKDTGYSTGDFVWDAWWFLARFVTGLLLLVLFRPFMRESIHCLSAASLRSLGLGALFLICLPIAAVILGLTVLGIPVAILVMLGWIVLIYLAPVFVGLAIGDMILGRTRMSRGLGLIAGMFLGVLIVALVTGIPYVGWLAELIVLCSGLGGFLLTAYRYHTGTCAGETAV
jgi:cytoskeletal protein CcmA (bactofilin family)